MRRLLFISTLLLSVVACSSDEPEASDADALDLASETTTTAPESTTTDSPTTASPSTSSTVATTTTVELVPPVEPVLSDLVGRWAHFDVVAYQDGDFKTLIVSYGFNDFTEEGGSIIDAASFCFSEQVTNQPITTSMSDAATQAIKPPSTPLQVEVDDDVLSIRREATPTAVGIRLDDPANESLPTDPDDPRIVDDDGDGNPGITVTIDVGAGLTGELYLARREVFSYDAVLVGVDRIEGSVIDQSEQLAIGASSPMFLQSADWEQAADPELNPVVLQRVDDDWDCQRLAAERDDVFPPTPAIDW